MRTMISGLIVLALAGPTFAIDKQELDKRTRKLTLKFAEMQGKPGKRIPPETLRKAHAIMLMDRTKAGFLFAYQGGSGVALAKDPKSGTWGSAAFLTASEASLGFLIGGQQSFVVILFLTPESANLLSNPSIDFGGEARGTAGDSSAGAEGTIANKETSVLVYDDRKGLYGGAAIKGGAISPDADANLAYYAQPLTMKEILFDKKVKPGEAAIQLAKKIEEYSRKSVSE